MQKNNHEPLVSIGLPTYNRARYLPRALDSLLGQTYKNFELIISDNASTDQTEDICRDYAARDHRIRYIRQKTNIGMVKNFNEVFTRASGVFFMWAGDDDWWEENYISTLLSILLEDKEVVLAYGITHCFGVGYEQDKYYDYSLYPDMQASNRVERIKSVFKYVTGCPIMGLMRRSLLPISMITQKFPDTDLVFLCELALCGKFKMTDKTMMHKERTKPIVAGVDKYRSHLEISRSTSKIFSRIYRVLLFSKRFPYLSLKILKAPGFSVGERLQLIKQSFITHFLSVPMIISRFFYKGQRSRHGF